MVRLGVYAKRESAGEVCFVMVGIEVQCAQ
jgi:hypothetical protein